MDDKVEYAHTNLAESFRLLYSDKELLAKVIDCFPYPIHVYAPDGTSVLVNKAMLADFNNISSDMVVGKYNVFKDPYIIELGQISALKRAFRGETVFFYDVRVPLEDIVKRYNVRDLDLEAVYQDITVFPIMNDAKEVIYVAALMINRRVYRCSDEIGKAREYIESHWMERFSSDEIAKAACLSKAHFTKLFKKHTGMTPHEYYTNYRMSKLKEKLLDATITIEQAFAACNMDYNGHSARLFRTVTGVSPSEYRKLSQNMEGKGGSK